MVAVYRKRSTVFLEQLTNLATWNNAGWLDNWTSTSPAGLATFAVFFRVGKALAEPSR